MHRTLLGLSLCLSGWLLIGTSAQSEEPAQLHQALLQIQDSLDPATDTALPADLLDAWWDPLIQYPVRSNTESVPLTLQDLVFRTLVHSKQIKVFSELPLIRETAIIDADSAYDWNAFLDSRWDDISEPVGNTLTVGGTGNRYNNHQFSGEAGLRRRTTTGAELKLSQQIGWQQNNSVFFLPNPQGTSRLNISLTQPLLRGRGCVYNTSLTVLAQIDKSIADDEFNRQLQSQLLEVTRAYWALYLERAVLYQRLEAYRRAAEVLGELEARRNLDASELQIVSAAASLKERRANLFRAGAAVKNAEAKIRALVNDPSLADAELVELIPHDLPVSDQHTTEIQQAFATAIRYRPEISQAMKQIKSAGVRLNMAKHELLPVLNLVTQTYLSGLEDRGDIPDSLVRQFDTGAPSYGIGLQYEVPLGNRRAAAQHRKRRHELRQLENQYETTLETIKLEVEVAVRELETARQELVAKHQAMVARKQQLDVLTIRWRKLSSDMTGSLALENMLTAQDQLTSAEFQFVQSQLTYNLSVTNLRKAQGILLQTENISIDCIDECNLPTLHAQQSAPFAEEVSLGEISISE
ncbi:MAG: TolC family protein [Pirellulaceae bacterium]